MAAMTWWDHETSSIWSQPWGMAITGSFEGVRLIQVPAAIEPWDAWLVEHPDTLVLATEEGLFGLWKAPYQAEFVIGIALGEDAKAYPFERASEEGVINDHAGPFPVVVVADPETKSVRSFVRRAGGQELEFNLLGDALVDIQTGSRWDLAKGIAVEGPLRGAVLQRVPYITSFDWAWQEFYPHSDFYH